MTSIEKLIQKIFSQSSISYDEAEKILNRLGFECKISGSHHVFRKPKFELTVSLKKRGQLLPYQINKLREVLNAHGYKKND